MENGLSSEKKVRESNFELLRLICIFGIITMHTFGSFYSSATGGNLVYGVLINTVFNMGVSLFMLISGYYGVRTSWNKIVYLEIATIFYAVLNVLVNSVIWEGLSKKALLRACFPVSDGVYWYITTYMLILVFARYINMIPEKLPKKDFQKLLFIMLVIFSILPSVIQLHVMGDNGKGIMNMLLMYLIGRYIKLYGKESYPRGKLLGAGSLVILIGFALNYGLSLLFQGGTGIYAPFARDCSITIVLSSIFIFLFFRECKFQSRVINGLAKYVIGIYLFEGTVRAVFREWFDITVYGDAWYLFGVIAVYTLLSMLICMIVEILRSATIGRCSSWIAEILQKIWSKWSGGLQTWLERL